MKASELIVLLQKIVAEEGDYLVGMHGDHEIVYSVELNHESWLEQDLIIHETTVIELHGKTS